MRILLTGATGQLGREFCRSRVPSGTSLIAASRQKLDLTRTSQFTRFFEEVRPDLVINTAAYTTVDDAEDNPQLAFSVNRDGAGALAKAAARRSIPIVHISTDYVFDGKKEGVWTEDDPTAPINVYGQSKLAGEIAVAASNPRHLIIRVSWLYASQGHNFLRTMLRLGRERDKLAVVNDQWGRPTCAADLAETALFMAFRAMSSDGLWGLYHFTNSGAPTTWHHFACEIFSLSRSRAGHHPSVEPIDAEQFHTAAARPKNSVLSLDKIDCVFGIKPRGWQTALADTLNEFHKSNIEMEAS